MNGRPRLATGAAFVLFLASACAINACFTRGIWLDEFWSYRMSDTRIPLRQLVVERWAHEANPATANMIYRLFAATGVQDIRWLRTLLNLPVFLLFVAATFTFARLSPTRSRFYLLFAVSVVGLPSFITTFSDYRSYFWQIGWSGVLIQLVYWMLVEDETPHLPPNRGLVLLGTLGVVFAIGLHFISGLIVSALVGLLLLLLACKRAWPPLRRLALPAGLVWAGMFVLAIWQYLNVRRELDNSWIQTSTWQALVIFALVPVAVLLANPVAVAFAVVRDRAIEPAAPDLLTRQRLFVGLLAAAILSSALLLLLLNAVRPVVVDRYLVIWQLFYCGMIAAFAAPAVAAARWRWLAVLACVLASLFYGALQRSREVGWNGTRDFIARTVAACPATQVYAMSPWRLTSSGSTQYAAYENLTFADSYQRLADDAGFAITNLGPEDRVLPLSTACPTLVWVEHRSGYWDDSANRIIGLGRLRFPRPAEAGLYRTASGFVLVVRPSGDSR